MPRHSTNGQTPENRLRDLEGVVEKSGWEIVGVYEEMVSGAKNRDKRPPAGKALFQMMGVFAEFFRERVRGASRKRLERGGAWGPRRKVDDALRRRIAKAVAAGKSRRQVARELQIGEATVRRALAMAGTAGG